MNSQLPPIFTERLQNIIPANDYDSAIKSFACPKPLQCRVNMLKTTRQEAEVYLQEKNVTFKPVEWSEDALDIFDVGSKTFGELEFVQQGKLYAQAFASMLPVLILNPQPDDCVLDMCAAPGSKTSQMAAAMNNQGSITAIEVVKNRYYRLKSVCDLLGVSNVEFKLTDARRFRANEQLFDKILVDAPCSSEGRFREQEPKSFAYWSLRKIKEMQRKQKGLLLSASRLLADGGQMVYSTCTYAPEENEAVVDWLLRKTDGKLQLEEVNIPGIKTYPCLTQWGKKTYHSEISKCMRVLPSERMEGFFVASFRKV